MSDPSHRPWLTFRVVVPFSIQSMHTHIHNWLSGTITDLPLWHFFILKFSLCPSNKNPARRTLWFYFCRCVSHCLLVVFLSFDSISLAIDSLLCCKNQTRNSRRTNKQQPTRKISTHNQSSPAFVFGPLTEMGTRHNNKKYDWVLTGMIREFRIIETACENGIFFLSVFYLFE